MKVTWFGGTTVRIHVGGAIVVVGPEGAPDGIDRTELVSGADRVIDGFGEGLASVDPAGWRRRPVPRMVDDLGGLPAVEVWSAGEGVLLVDAVGEPPLVLVAGELPRLGRWAADAVVVLFGEGEALERRGLALLEESPPRLIGLAGDEAAIDRALPALRDRLDGVGLVALEAGMALEI